MTTMEPSRRERKKDETRERIAQAAFELFTQKGFESTTIDDIAQRADVAKGTFFNYFPRKETVIAALVDQKMAEMEDVGRAILESDSPARDKLLALCSAFSERHLHNREISRVYVSQLMTRLGDEVCESPARARELISSVIAHGQGRGEFRSDVEPMLAAGIIQSMALGTLLMWHWSEPGSFDLTAQFKQRVTLLLDGLAIKGGAS